MLSKRSVLLRSSLRSVAPFAMVVFIYLHVFAVAGMYMYGGLNVTEAIQYEEVGSLGYDDYVSAMVTTFQLFTGEGWNTIMYSSVSQFGNLDSVVMEGANTSKVTTGVNQVNVVLAVIYYLTGTAVGNLLLLKLVLAIILDSYFAYSALMEKKKLRENLPKQIDRLKEKLEQKRSLLLEQRKVSKRFLSLQSLAMSTESDSTDNRLKDWPWLSSLKSGIALRLSGMIAFLEEYHVLDNVGVVFVLGYCIANLFKASEGRDVVIIICLVAFSFEFLARTLSDFVMERLSVFTLLDFFALLCAFLGYCLDFPVTNALQSVVALRFLRFSRELRVICTSLAKAAPGCLIVLSYSFIVLSVFAVFSVDLLGGRFHDCVDSRDFVRVPKAMNKTCFNFTNVPQATQYDRLDCPAINNCDANGTEWHNPKRKNLTGSDFDTYGSAMQAMFEISTLQLWNEVMFQATRVTTIGQSPQDGSSIYMGPYFCLLVLISYVFLLQLFITNVIKMFLTMERKETGDEFLTDNQRLWVENQIRVIFQRPRQVSICLPKA